MAHIGARCFAYVILFNLIFTKSSEVGIIIINSQQKQEFQDYFYHYGNSD